MSIEKPKRLGILGGMGPQATQYFFQRIIAKTDAKRDQDHIDMVIFNQATTPDRTEAILSKNDNDFMVAIEYGLRLLEKCEVENIAIPCNTTHYFFDKVQSKTKIPIINMVEETVKYVVQKNKSKTVGILATDGTIRAKTYENECKKQGVSTIVPSEENQKEVMKIIYEEVKSGKAPNINKFLAIVHTLKERGCDSIILACTELSYLKANYDIPEYCVDALEILVNKSIELSGKQVKN